MQPSCGSAHALIEQQRPDRTTRKANRQSPTRPTATDDRAPSPAHMCAQNPHNKDTHIHIHAASTYTSRVTSACTRCACARPCQDSTACVCAASSQPPNLPTADCVKASTAAHTDRYRYRQAIPLYKACYQQVPDQDKHHLQVDNNCSPLPWCCACG